MTASRSFVRCAATCLLVASLPAQSLPTTTIQNLLPKDAKIIETATLNTGRGKARSLVLWMENPERIVRQDSGGCADDVYGDHWIGATRLSLVDSAKPTLVNTIEIRPFYGPLDDREFHIPFLVSSLYYHVPRPNAKREGQPTILNLQDLTGEGVAGQFVLFEYAACGIVSTSVFGYSPRFDRATQYSIEVLNPNQKPEIQFWVDQVFAKQPSRPGYWNFTWDPGHGSESTIHEQVSFDRERQLFVDNQETRPYPGTVLK
jgi:hypothetical protein